MDSRMQRFNSAFQNFGKTSDRGYIQDFQPGIFQIGGRPTRTN